MRCPASWPTAEPRHVSTRPRTPYPTLWGARIVPLAVTWAFRRPEDVADSIPCGNSVDAVAEAAGAFFKAGFTDLALVQIGGTEPEQDRSSRPHLSSSPR